MTVTVARMNDRVVEVVRVADAVAFSSERGWVMVCFDFDKAYHKRAEFRWVPASTQFDWVRTFAF